MNTTAILNNRIQAQTEPELVMRKPFAAVLYLAAVAAPLVFATSQLLAGTAVNALLVLGLLRLGSRRALLPLVVLPSLAALWAGWLAGAAGLGAALLLPAIWGANGLYLLCFHALGARPTALPVAAGAKAGLLMAAVALLVGAGLLPAALLPGMAALQFFTAVAGGAIALLAHRFIRPLR